MKFEKEIRTISKRNSSFAENGKLICDYVHKNISYIVHEKLSRIHQGFSLKIEVSKAQRLFEDEKIIVELQHRLPTDIKKLKTIKSSEYEKVLASLNSSIIINVFKENNGQLKLTKNKNLLSGVSILIKKNSIISLCDIKKETYFVVVFNKMTISQTIKMYSKENYLYQKEISAISKDSRIKIWTDFVIKNNVNLNDLSLSDIINDESTPDLKIDLLKKMYKNSPNNCVTLLKDLSIKQDDFSIYAKNILTNLGPIGSKYA